MMNKSACFLGAALVLLAPGLVYAQEEIPEGEERTEEASEVSAAAEQEVVEAIVTGFFIEGRVGGGYTVLDDGNEKLGPGAMVQLAAGYDINDAFAVEAVGGGTLISTLRSRTDVRDLGLVFGAVAGRLSFDITERLEMLGAVGFGVVSADNGVEAAQSGALGLANLGLEYYVHVRHFSVGIDVSVFAPLSPLRAFVGVTPRIKYTF